MPRIQIDLVKQILLALEDSFPYWRGIDVGIDDDRLRSYYVDFLRRDGLVEAKNWRTDQTGDDWKATRLTPDGHRMAEALRSAPPNWHEQAAKSFKAEGSSLTWEVAKRYLSQLPDEERQEWDVFVCYASEDREDVAGPLAAMLTELGLRVWYDQMELRVGDSLRRRIDDGLSRCRFGVVILSESFFGKHYPESELNGLDQREHDGGKVILPVWHDVDVAAVRRHSPRLADRVALKWQDGIAAVVAGLLEVVAPDLLRSVIERYRELIDYAYRARVPRITTGAELTALFGTYGFFFLNDELVARMWTLSADSNKNWRNGRTFGTRLVPVSERRSRAISRRNSTISKGLAGGHMDTSDKNGPDQGEARSKDRCRSWSWCAGNPGLSWIWGMVVSQSHERTASSRSIRCSQPALFVN